MGIREGETKHWLYGCFLEWDMQVLFLSGWKLQQGAVHGAQPGSASLEPLISAQTGKTLLICMPRFPGILNKCFPSWELGWGIITYNSNYKENGLASLVYRIGSHHSTENNALLSKSSFLFLIFFRVLSNWEGKKGNPYFCPVSKFLGGLVVFFF